MQMPSDALRSTSDDLIRDLDVLATLEEEKRTLAPDDPRFGALAARIAEVAERVLAASRRQRELSQDASREAILGPSATRPIDDRPRSIHDVLSEWREAERRLAAAAPGSAEEAEAQVLVRHLRAEYQRAREAAES
jgi:hypothetical protein